MNSLIDQTCEGCKYRNVDNTNQCKRYIKMENDNKILCNEGETAGDIPLTENDTGSCMPEMCPASCYLPYPKEFFNQNNLSTDSPNSFYNDEGVKTEEELKELKEMYKTSPNNFDNIIVNLSSQDSVNSDFTGVYDENSEPGITNKNIQFKCGPLNSDINYPVKPTSSEYTNFLSSTANVSQTTDWTKVKSSELIDIDVPQHVLSDNGVDLNIFVDGTFIDIDNNNEELIALLRYEGLDTSLLTLTKIYDETIGNITQIGEVQEFLSSSESDYLDEGESSEPFPKKLSEGIIREWSRNQLLMHRLTGRTEKTRVGRLLDVFMISTSDGTNVELEECLNNLLNTDTGTESDDEYVRRIGNYSSIHELGKHPRDVKYIEDKVKKFLGANTDDLVECFLKSNIQYENICQNGFSSRPMEMLSNLMKVKEGLNNDSEIYEEKFVVSKLLKYVPDVMKKILDISEKFEMESCDRVSRKTMLYKEIYRDLFLESNVLKFGLPDMGVNEFFSDFNSNIYTKIILLIFLAYIFSKIVSLFKVNVSV